jgi:methionyl-tRNA synthetase
MKKKYIVTITPPTPNGDLHLGHLAGPFLAADIMQRTLKQQGHDVLFVTYSDDYQSYLPRKTATLNREPFDYARLMRRAMSLSLSLVGIEPDCFLQAAHHPAYRRAGEFYAGKIAGQLTYGPYKTFHCAPCDRYGYEGFGRTHCNWCGTSSDASQCEHCARVPDIHAIQEMACISCGEKMQEVSVPQHLWRIGENYPQVAQALAAQPKRPCLATWLDEVLRNEQDCWPISRPGDAGLPLDATAQAPVHTWFLGLAGYRACVEAALEAQPERGRFSEWWAPETALVHFLGFDCSYSHAVAYSSLLLADDTGPKPGSFFTNRFLKLDGEDFSTSRGHAVWIKDLTAHYPADAIRLYSALFAPETAVENFDRRHFADWVSSVFTPLRQLALQGERRTAALTPEQQLALSDSAWGDWLHASSSAHFSAAGMARSALAWSARLQQDDAWCTSPQAWQRFAMMIAPLCPDLARDLRARDAQALPVQEWAHEQL